MRKKYVLFDLDGTLTDPMEGITKSVQCALRRYGIEEPDLEKLCPFIGPPLKGSFMRYYGFGEEQAAQAVQVFREYFSAQGIFENRVYPGMEQALEGLRAAGMELFVATSKPEVFARQILEHFGLARYFAFIGGADMEEIRVKKGDVIRYVMEEAGIGDASLAVMAGDREHDILGAKENAMASLGVLFGYGSREELLSAGADAVAGTVEEMGRILLTKEDWPC